MSHECTKELFLLDVSRHKMRIVRDDGLHRHIYFGEPGSSIQHFQLITWPGYLCYVGDMGAYVFERTEDMFTFFRRPALNVNLSYWGEKLQAVDRGDGYRKFSPEKFRANIMRWIEERGLTGKLGHGLRDDLQQEIFSKIEDGCDRGEAYRAAADFMWQGKDVFPDFWEVDSDEYSFRFVWCCYALAWGIEQYDQAKVQVTEEVPA